MRSSLTKLYCKIGVGFICPLFLKLSYDELCLFLRLIFSKFQYYKLFACLLPIDFGGLGSVSRVFVGKRLTDLKVYRLFKKTASITVQPTAD